MGTLQLGWGWAGGDGGEKVGRSWRARCLEGRGQNKSRSLSELLLQSLNQIHMLPQSHELYNICSREAGILAPGPSNLNLLSVSELIVKSRWRRESSVLPTNCF